MNCHSVDLKGIHKCEEVSNFNLAMHIGLREKALEET